MSSQVEEKFKLSLSYVRLFVLAVVLILAWRLDRFEQRIERLEHQSTNAASIK